MDVVYLKKLLESQFWNLDSCIKIQIPNATFQNPESRIQIPGSRFQMPDSRFRNPDSRYWAQKVEIRGSKHWVYVEGGGSFWRTGFTDGTSGFENRPFGTRARSASEDMARHRKKNDCGRAGSNRAPRFSRECQRARNVNEDPSHLLTSSLVDKSLFSLTSTDTGSPDLVLRSPSTHPRTRSRSR